jgi:choloylglycine hydrolase
MYWGRNLDWGFSYGESVITTPRGHVEDWAFNGADADPRKGAHEPYAMIGMGIVVDDKPLYFDCGNETGLACGGLMFSGFGVLPPEPVEGKYNVAAYEFPTWICSMFASVDEAEAALKNTVIVGKQVNDKYALSYLHYFIADSKRSIVVEQLEDGLHIHRNPVDVLTNQPTFDWHLENLRTYLHVSPELPPAVTWDKHELAPFGSGFGMHGLPGDFTSPSRFVRAAYFNAHYPAQKGEDDNVSRLFKTLQGSAMIKGGSTMQNGMTEYTLYSGCYSAATKTYYYNTYEDPAIKAVHMEDTDLSNKTLAIGKPVAPVGAVGIL